MYMRYARHVGKTIRSLRMQQKLSQEQLAAKVQLLGCDLTRSALAKICFFTKISGEFDTSQGRTEASAPTEIPISF